MQFGRGIAFLPPYRCTPIERVNISSTSPTYYATLFVFQYRKSAIDLKKILRIPANYFLIVKSFTRATRKSDAR